MLYDYLLFFIELLISMEFYILNAHLNKGNSTMKLKLKSLNHVIRDVVRRANPQVPAHIFDMYDIFAYRSSNSDGPPTKLKDHQVNVSMSPKPEFYHIVGEEYIDLELNALFLNEFLDVLYEDGLNVWATPTFEELPYYREEFAKFGLYMKWGVDKKYYKNKGMLETTDEAGTIFLLHTVNSEDESEKNKYGKTYGEIRGRWDKLVYDPNSKQIGLMLDMARTSYTAVEVCKAIDYLVQNNGTYIQLHISDNESVVYPFDILKGASHHLSDSLVSRNLAKADFRTIVNYAKRKGIDVIFELNTPGHCNGIRQKILDDEFGELNQHYSELFLEDGTMNFNSWRLRKLVKDLLDELITDMGQDNIKYIHLGGDEFPFNENWSHEIPEYYNNIQEHLYDYGITMRVWNDSLLKKDIVAGRLDDRIEVTYWSWDGQRQDQEQAQHLRDIRATPKDLIDHGIRVINCQGYYTYAVPKATDFTSHDATYSARDMFGNWDLSKWDRHETAVPLAQEDIDKGVIGAQLSIWGENLGFDHIDKTSVLNNYSYMMRNIARICKAYGKDPNETLEDIKAIYRNGFVNEEYDVFMDAKLGYRLKGEEGNVYDLSYNGSNVLYFNNLKSTMNGNNSIKATIWGNGNDYVKLPNTFIKDENDTKYNDEYNVTAHAWKYDNGPNTIKFYIDERIKVIYIEEGEYPYQPIGEGDVPIKERNVIDLGKLITDITVTEEPMTEDIIESISIKPENLNITVNKDELLIDVNIVSGRPSDP